MPPTTDKPFASVEDSTLDVATPARPGRKRDPSRDAAILDATLGVLADVGYDGLTMDLIAERARASKATIYRRWASKEALVLDAVAGMSETVEPESLPDTGTLRGDMLGLFQPKAPQVTRRKLDVMAGLATLLSAHPERADEVNAALVEPWVQVNRVLMQRALDRGELRASADVETAARVIPSMAVYRSLVQRRPFEEDFLLALLDGVLLPALLRHP